jgi:succinate dehydrogenase / fumarate reductase iron-sulfur subunit
MSKKLQFKLRIWRQAGPKANGQLKEYTIDDVAPEQSILEMLDTLNEQLIKKGEEPVAFDSDCREGICGTCGLVIDGVAHGPKGACTTCELRMRSFQNGQTITIEPFRADAFPVVKDLTVDRSAFDRIIQCGGYIGVNTGAAPEANLIAIPRDNAELAMDAAACIGCGACVASCPNASASLFVGAKVSQYANLPQGKTEAKRRVLRMVQQMDEEGFGSCSNHAECEAVCPKEIPITNIAQMRREHLKAALKGAE